MQESQWLDIRREIDSAVYRVESRAKREPKAAESGDLRLTEEIEAAVYKIMEDFLPPCFYKVIDACDRDEGYFMTHVHTPHFTLRFKFPERELELEPKVETELWLGKSSEFQLFDTLDEAIWFAAKYNALPATDKEMNRYYNPF